MELRNQAQVITAVCLTVLTVLSIGAALFWLRPVVVPFVLAVFLSISAAPVVDFLKHRVRLPGTLAIVVTLVLGVALLVVIATIAAQAVTQLNADREIYARQLEQLEADLFEPALAKFGVKNPGAVLDSLEPKDGIGIIGQILAAVLSIASDGAVVLIYLFFLLASHSSFEPATAGTWFRIRNSIAHYISLKVAVSALTAVTVWATLMLLGVPLAVVFGLLTFVLNFIPNVGSLIAIVLPVPVVLMNPDLGPTAKLLAIAIPSTVQFAVGNIVEPKLMGRSLDLHPVVILLGLIVWGMLWGIVGVFLAVPLTSALKIVFEELGYTQPIADLFSGRPKPRA